MMNGDGTHPHQLTSRRAATPAVSPDGKWIYFASAFAGMDQGESAIWRLPLEGGEPSQVTTSVTERQSRPVVSRDGKWLYFTSGDGARFRTMKVEADGGEGKELTKPEFMFRADQLTPDGSRLYGFAIDRSHPQRGNRPGTVSVDGGAPDFPENLQHFGRLLPDGTAIVSEDQRNGTEALFLRSLAGGAERQLVDLGQDSVAWRLAITSDSKTLAFVRGRETSDVVLIKAK
jgi:Tol biopolymer transport system component